MQLFLAVGDDSVLGAGATDPSRSFAARLHGRLARFTPGVAFERVAAPGLTAKQLVERMLGRGADPAPAVATLAIGSGDLLRGTSPEEFEHEVGILVAMLVRMSPLVVVHLMPDLALTPNIRGTARAHVLRKRIAVLNGILRLVAQRHGAAIADLELWSIAAYDDAELFAPGGYHLSDEGHAVWAQLTWPVFQHHLEAPRAWPAGTVAA